MNIEEIIKEEEKKGFFDKIKNILSPRNLILTGCLLYTSLIGKQKHWFGRINIIGYCIYNPIRYLFAYPPSNTNRYIQRNC